MKKSVKIILIIIACAAVIAAAVVLICHCAGTPSVPKEYKNAEVSFVSPDIKWNSTLSDVKKVYGEPQSIEKNELKGGKDYHYEMEYDGFKVNAVFSNYETRYVANAEYEFLCEDEAEALTCFESLKEKLKTSYLKNEYNIEEDGEKTFYFSEQNGRDCSLSVSDDNRVHLNMTLFY